MGIISGAANLRSLPEGERNEADQQDQGTNGDPER
jgi:hypothetical protein